MTVLLGTHRQDTEKKQVAHFSDLWEKVTIFRAVGLGTKCYFCEHWAPFDGYSVTRSQHRNLASWCLRSLGSVALLSMIA